MDPSPQDRLFRWLIEMILAYPLITECEHPPDPSHNEWMPAGPELDLRAAVRAYLEMTTDNVIWLFPRADEAGPGAEGSGEAGGGAVAEGPVAATGAAVALPVDAGSDRAAPAWRSRLRWSGAGVLGGLVAALVVAALVWPGEPGGRDGARAESPVSELPVTDYEFATGEPTSREVPTREAPVDRRPAGMFITEMDALLVSRPHRSTNLLIEVTEVDKESADAPGHEGRRPRRVREVDASETQGMEAGIGDDRGMRLVLEVD